jgi:glycine cleavage system transcriptional repressor
MSGKDHGGIGIIEISQFPASLQGALDSGTIKPLVTKFEGQLPAGVIPAGEDSEGTVQSTGFRLTRHAASASGTIGFHKIGSQNNSLITSMGRRGQGTGTITHQRKGRLMEQRFIMTAFGQDRPGIAADVCQIIYENGCNLEDTSMTLLAGEFTLILLFTAGSADVAAPLSRACRRLEQEKGISAFLRPLEPQETVPPDKVFMTRKLHVEGMDQSGIVYKISRFLADNRINITDLKSSVIASPESGTALYVMDILVQIPDGTDMDAVEKGLRSVADTLNVDIALSVG